MKASELFTPADIEFAGRKAAQTAFEPEHCEEEGRRAVTTDFLDALDCTKPPLPLKIVRDFCQYARRFMRY